MSAGYEVHLANPGRASRTHCRGCESVGRLDQRVPTGLAPTEVASESLIEAGLGRSDVFFPSDALYCTIPPRLITLGSNNFFEELKRRNVYKVAVAYAVVGWLVMQVAATVVPALHLPGGITTGVVVLTLLGFPIALVIAWAFEMTPEGMKRTENISPTEHIPYWSRRKFAIFIAVVAVLAATLLGFQLWRAKSKSPAASANTGNSVPANKTQAVADKSIAVLPLLNESADPKDEYFSDGLSEELIAALTQIEELKVIGRSSSFRFKERKDEPRTIGEKLGVATLLEGTVRKQGDRVRIVAELIKAVDGSALWTQTFDRELKDIFAVQEEIATAVASSLKVRLLGNKDAAATNASTKSVEAHNAYLEGHFHFARRNFEDYGKAIGFYNQAIQFDPDYAPAYAERSEAWTFIGDLNNQQKKEAWRAAKSDAEKAVAIGPKLAEAHAALGWVRYFVEWRFPEGLAELRQARQLAPANPTANDLLARVLVYSGQIQEAEALARQTIELDPLLFIARNNLARILFVEGKLDEAEVEGRKAAELQPTAASSHRWQALVAVTRADGENALREALLEPDPGYHRYLLALAHYVRRDRQAADAALADLIANGRGTLDYQIAQVYAWRGETDKAFEWLEISFASHDTGLLAILRDPLMRGLHDDPRYKSVVTKLGLPGRYE